MEKVVEVGVVEDVDVLLPDPKVQKRYGVSAMTIHRWDHDPTLGFPPPVRIKKRKYRRLSQLIEFERAATAKVRTA